MDSGTVTDSQRLHEAYLKLNVCLEEWVKLSWKQEQYAGEDRSEDLALLVDQREALMPRLLETMSSVRAAALQVENTRENDSWSLLINAEIARATRLHAEAVNADTACAGIISSKMNKLAQRANDVKARARHHLAYRQRQPATFSRFLDQDS